MKDHPPPLPHILLVDDEEANLKSFIRVFRKTFAITTALSASDALREVKQASFVVALIDYRMPGVSGVDLAQILSTQYPTIPCILLTGSPYAHEVCGAVNNGICAEVIGKPWTKNMIVECVMRHANKT